MPIENHSGDGLERLRKSLSASTEPRRPSIERELTSEEREGIRKLAEALRLPETLVKSSEPDTPLSPELKHLRDLLNTPNK